VRAGTHALTLLSVPLNVHVLTTLEEEPMTLVDLRRTLGSPPQTTMRGHLREMAGLGVVERARQADFPGAINFKLGPAGPDLLFVVSILRTWLANAPDGSLEPGAIAARSAIKALVEGWSSNIIRALAAKPLSLTDLNRLISNLNYPSLERRLSALRLTGLITPAPSGGRGTPYVATDWLRQGVALLAASARWERKHIPEKSAPIGRLDIESAFLLSLPLVNLSPELNGSCRLAVDVRGSAEHRLAGVVAQIGEGRVVACAPRLEGNPAAWVSGSAAAWMRAVVGRDPENLVVGGDVELAEAIVTSLHWTLAGSEQTH